MLPGKARLRSSRDFRALYARARSYKAPHLVLYVRPARPQAEAANAAGRAPLRIGFSISKKVAKKAHERNLLKRRLREITRITILPIVRDERLFDAVVVARSAAPAAEYVTLSQEMVSLFSQAGVIDRG